MADAPALATRKRSRARCLRIASAMIEAAVFRRDTNNTSGTGALRTGVPESASRDSVIPILWPAPTGGPAQCKGALPWRGASRPPDAPCVAARGWLRRFFRWRPGLPRPLLDIAPNQSSHDLRGRCVLLGAQALEKSLLARINEDRDACGAIFEGH